MQFFNYTVNETSDVIFLVKTVNLETYQMTADAITSLRQSEINNKFRVILVESSQDNPPKYDAEVTINYSGEFNYNKALNMAFQYLESDYVCVFNNDVNFRKDWYSVIRYYMDIFNLDSASPRCPVPQVGPSVQAQQMILNYPEAAVILGYEALIHFCGWGWVMKREVLDLLRPMPEDLTFWFQDNHMALELKKFNKKHGCVTSSHVIHYGQKSYKYIEPSDLYKMTHGLQDVFAKKWQ